MRAAGRRLRSWRAEAGQRLKRLHRTQNTVAVCVEHPQLQRTSRYRLWAIFTTECHLRLRSLAEGKRRRTCGTVRGRGKWGRDRAGWVLVLGLVPVAPLAPQHSSSMEAALGARPPGSRRSAGQHSMPPRRSGAHMGLASRARAHAPPPLAHLAVSLCRNLLVCLGHVRVGRREHALQAGGRGQRVCRRGRGLGCRAVSGRRPKPGGMGAARPARRSDPAHASARCDSTPSTRCPSAHWAAPPRPGLPPGCINAPASGCPGRACSSRRER